MQNFSTVTNTIVKELASIQQLAEGEQSERGYIFTSAQQERSFMVAGGMARHGLRELATKLCGSFIPTIADVVPETAIELSPKAMLNNDRSAPARVSQSLNDSIKMVGLHMFLLSGHANALAITTALTNWIEADNVQAPFDCELAATNCITQMLKAGLIEQGTATAENGGTFETFGLVQHIQDLRLKVMRDIWTKATPRLKPMQYPLRWLHDGTCELPNFKLMKGQSKFNADFVESFNLLGHVPYTANEQIQDLCIDWLEDEQQPDTTELNANAAKRVNDGHSDLVEIVSQLTMLPTGIPLYFPHTADWRGRAYARGGLTQFQSVKECRSMLDFYKPVTVKDNTGLFLHIANCYGKDKASINDRIKWVKRNLVHILKDAHSETTPQSGAEFYARRAALALAEYNTTGETNIICHIDGTCNGTQWVSAMFRDAVTGKYVNICKSSHNDTPFDLYGRVSEVAAQLTTAAIKDCILKHGRELTKPVVMVLGYGASEQTLLREVTHFLESKGDKTDAKAVTEAITHAINIAAPALTKLTKNLKMRLKREPRNTASWCVPDLKVITTNKDDTHLILYSSMFGGKLTGQAKPDNKAFARGISPNYVHSLDSAHLRAVVRKAGCYISGIHDSIGADANNVLRVNELIRQEFYNLNQVDLVSNIYTQLNLRYKPSRGSFDISEVLEASYIFS